MNNMKLIEYWNHVAKFVENRKHVLTVQFWIAAGPIASDLVVKF